MSLAYASNILGRKFGLYQKPIISAPYVPNYPTGLSGIAGLAGWYDSSNASSVITSSGLVSEWKNIFNGATQGATVLPSFLQNGDLDSSAPSYQTNGQKYLYPSGNSNRSGIFFRGGFSSDQADTFLDCIPNIGFSQFSAFFVVPLSNQYPDVSFQGYGPGTILSINDTTGAGACYDSFMDSVAPDSGGVLFAQRSPLGSTGPYTVGYVKCANILSRQWAFGAAGSLTSRSPTSGVTIIPPPNIPSLTPTRLRLGGTPNSAQVTNGVTTGAFAGPIAEVLIYSSYVSDANTTTIVSYLSSKWN